MPSWKKLIVSGSDANLNSLSVTQNVTAAGFSGSFSGSFQGNGSGLTGIVFDIGSAASYSEAFTNQTTVTVVHSLNTEYPFVQVYDTADELFIPLTVKVIDVNTVRVDFSVNTSGNIVVAKGGHIVQGTAANADLLEGQPGSYYLDYTNFTNLPPAGDSFPYTGSAIISGSLNVIGPISSSGNIIPTTLTQDLGTVTSPWRDLFVSTASIKFSNGVETIKTLTAANLVTTESLASQLPVGVISSSAQVSYTGLSNIPTGIVSGSSQINFSGISGVPAGLVSGSSQISYTDILNVPSGIVSSSTQVESIVTPLLNSYATTGSNIFQGTQTITGSLFISNNLVVQGQTALEFITASAVSIGTNKIILNEDTPAVRYAGISVIDSGSTSVTASFLWDGLNNQWVFEFEEPGENPDSSVALFGPLSENGLGTERGLFNNYVVKVQPNNHGHHLVESIIQDTGSEIHISGSTYVTGSFRADTYINLPAGIVSGSSQVSLGGDLTGTANNAQIAAGAITNDDINASAGIVYTKLNLNGSNLVSGSSQVSYTGLSNIPAGIVSGSSQLNNTTLTGMTISGSFSGSFQGNGSQLVVNDNVRTERLELGVASTSGTAITTGAKGRKTFGQAGTIIAWRLVSDTSTTTTLDIWKSNNAIPTNANSIAGSAKPSLTTAQVNSTTTLTGWTTSVSVGDVFILEVESNDNAQYLALELDILLSNT